MSESTSKRLPGLDGLRGLLAVLVAYAHAYGHITGWNSGLSFVHDASFAVDVFFMLSGVVLINAYADRFGRSAKGWLMFLAIRFLRLWPLYALSIFVIMGLYHLVLGSNLPNWIVPAGAERSTFISNLLWFNSLLPGDIKSINHPGWSISIEFYIGALVMCLCFLNRLIFSFLIAVIASWLIIAHNVPFTGSSTIVPGAYLTAGALRCMISMSAAIFVGEVMAIIRFGRLFLEAIAILTVMIILTFILVGSPPSHVGYVISVFVCSFGILAISKGGLMTRILDSPLFVHLGKISYSIYLIHVPMIYILLSAINTHAVYVVHLVIAATIFLSHWTYRYVERPFINLGHQLWPTHECMTSFPRKL